MLMLQCCLHCNVVSILNISRPPAFLRPYHGALAEQVVKLFERVLYAADEAEAKTAMKEAQQSEGVYPPTDEGTALCQ